VAVVAATAAVVAAVAEATTEAGFCSPKPTRT